MAEQEQSKDMIRVFTFLIKQEIKKDFTFPKGGIAKKAVDSCLKFLQERFNRELSQHRIVDFCVCQVYAITRFDTNYMSRWNVSHSFGKKALERFVSSHSGKKFYEDKWLATLSLSRSALLDLIKDRRQHPLYKYVYMEFEDRTKQRISDLEVRMLICRMSTMLWSPFSPICEACEADCRCKNILQKMNPELYRIRIEEFEKQQKK